MLLAAPGTIDSSRAFNTQTKSYGDTAAALRCTVTARFEQNRWHETELARTPSRAHAPMGP